MVAPMPWLVPMNSETIEPTIAALIASFAPANRYGRLVGRRSRKKISAREAAIDRNTSSACGSTDCNPLIALISIGKKAATAATMTCGTALKPKATISAGEMATIGVTLSSSATGTTADRKNEKWMTVMANVMASAVPIRKPISAAYTVTHRFDK